MIPNQAWGKFAKAPCFFFEGVVSLCFFFLNMFFYSNFTVDFCWVCLSFFSLEVNAAVFLFTLLLGWVGTFAQS